MRQDKKQPCESDGRSCTGNISALEVRRHGTRPEEDAVGNCRTTHASADSDVHLCPVTVAGESDRSFTLRCVRGDGKTFCHNAKKRRDARGYLHIYGSRAASEHV